MSAPSPSVLLYCEDPGAANFMIGLPHRLQAIGCRAKLLASGPAFEYLRVRGEAPECLPPDAAESVTDQPAADLVVVGTSENANSPGLELVDAARRRGIPSVGIVDGEAHADRRFRGHAAEPLAHMPDWLVVPDNETGAAYRQLGVESAKIAVCGWPHLDRAIAVRQRLKALGCDAVRAKCLPAAESRPVIVFLAEQSFSLDPESPVDADPDAFPGPPRPRVQAALKSVIEALQAVDGAPYLVLRLHPKNSPTEFGAFGDRVDEVSSGGDPLELLFCADLVVGLTTTLLAEAVMLGTPTLPINTCAWDRQWMPRMFCESLPVATSADDVRLLLPALLTGKTSLSFPSPPFRNSVQLIADFLAGRVSASVPPA